MSCGPATREEISAACGTLLGRHVASLISDDRERSRGPDSCALLDHERPDASSAFRHFHFDAVTPVVPKCSLKIRMRNGNLDGFFRAPGQSSSGIADGELDGQRAVVGAAIDRGLKGELGERDDLGGHPKPAINGHLKTGHFLRP